MNTRAPILQWMFVAAVAALSFTDASAGSSVSFQAGNDNILLEFYTPSTVRVVKTQTDIQAEPKSSLSVTATPEDVKLTEKKNGKSITVSSSELTVRVNLTDAAVTFMTPSGKTLLKEVGAPVFTPFNDAGRDTYSVRQNFTFAADEAIYGFGNLENGKLSQRGINRKLQPGNVEDGIPAFVSVKGYGLFWDNYSPTTFADENGIACFDSEVGDMVDYYFMYGKTADGVIAEMRHLSGDVPMFPLWTYGFWQSRERYKTQQETLGVVKKHRELGVPLDGIIQDWQYWGNNYLWNAMEFMNADFSRPQEMVDSIHANNANIIISIWSSFGPATKPYKELNEKGMLFNIGTWPQSGIAEQWPPRMDYPSGVRVYDCYNPEARDIYWNNLKRLHAYGMDGWWMDSTEPDHLDWKPEDMDTKTYLGSFRKVRGAYPLLTVGGVYDHQRAGTDAKRVFILTRSGFFGQQRYGCNVWTGDVSSTWKSLRNQLPAHMNFSMTGNPNCNSDIGGFFAGAYNTDGPNSAVKNPQFQELYLRWIQHGALTPMMRSHGADIKREIYYFGNPGEVVYDAIEDAIKLRYRLLPYIYSTSWDVSKNASTFMRPLVMDFPADKKGWDRGDQYMFGKSLLVAPIVDPHYTPEKIMRINEMSGWDKQDVSDTDGTGAVNFLEPYDVDVYLPAGTSWWDFETNQLHKGGKEISKKADIRTLPLYVKAGSVLPIGPDVQYATEKPWDALEIRVYPGADSEFTLYEDEFDNYNYEKGAYTTIRFNWNDKTRTLTIADREGEFPGMLRDRKFLVSVASDGKSLSAPVSIDYSGSKTSVRL